MIFETLKFETLKAHAPITGYKHMRLYLQGAYMRVNRVSGSANYVNYSSRTFDCGLQISRAII